MRADPHQTPEVVIHLYRFQDLNIVLDVGSGAVHAVSDPVYDVLSFYDGLFKHGEKHKRDGSFKHKRDGSFYVRGDTQEEPGMSWSFGDKYPAEEVREAMAEIDELKAAGLLFAPAPSEEEVSPEGRGAVIKAMCLHVAHDCNMRCDYCFADSGGFSGSRSLMPLETGKKAIDFLLGQSGARRNLEVDFFGGEPLMNFDVVKELVLYGREREEEYGKHIRFTLTTNGLLLDDEKTAFINEHMDNVILSIDGRPEVNDRMRKTVSGEGTYAQIIKKLKKFVEARTDNAKRSNESLSEDCPMHDSSLPDSEISPNGGSSLYYVRGTYTAFNKDFAEDVRHLASLGFENISIEPAVTAADEPWALTEADLPELYAEYDRLAELVLESEAAGNPISFFHFKVDLEQGPCVFKRVSGCGAGTAYVAVTPEGDIYPCHQFAGEPEYKIGNVHDVVGAQDGVIENKPAETIENKLAGTFENKLAETFEKAHIFSKEECRGCWAKYYCSGGCHAAALHCEGDLLKPHRLSCALEKKRLECAIGLAAKRTLADTSE